MKYLKRECLKVLDILKVLSSSEWGADRDVLLPVYRTLVQSQLDYGSIVYGFARKLYTRQLDMVHQQGLRLALGAFCTSPIQSLYVEPNEPSLYNNNRRVKLAMQYMVKLKTNTLNPAYSSIFERQRICI